MCGGASECQAPHPSASDPHHDGELFTCLICLELVYKPIVQPCGHVFCFWCIRRSMNAKRQSQCPVCRRPYLHFSRICEMLHFFLISAWPEEHRRRAHDIQEMEETKKVFSPRLLDPPISFWSPRKPDDQAKTATVRQWERCTPAVSPGEPNDQLSELTNVHDSRLLESIMEDLACSETREEPMIVCSQQGSYSTENGTSNTLSVSEEAFCCAACHKFLYRPVVLNCGEVCCESCLKTSDSSTLACPSCGSCDPRGPIHVCLELHLYLEGAFSASYLERQKEIELSERNAEDLAAREYTDSETSDVADEMEVELETECRVVHIGTGCDGCGMFPIVGHRYQCKDCSEQIGYDLCGSCYRSSAVARLCGRFNQQHTPDHRMEEVFSEFRWANTPPLNFNLQNGAISRRRLQQVLADFDDYIDSFV